MHSSKELSCAIRKAMERKNLEREELRQSLGVSRTMIDKIIAGDVVPSRHLEKQLIELLGISEERVRRVARARWTAATRERLAA